MRNAIDDRRVHWPKSSGPPGARLCRRVRRDGGPMDDRCFHRGHLPQSRRPLITEQIGHSNRPCTTQPANRRQLRPRSSSLALRWPDDRRDCGAHHGSSISYDTTNQWTTWATVTRIQLPEPAPDDDVRPRRRGRRSRALGQRASDESFDDGPAGLDATSHARGARAGDPSQADARDIASRRIQRHRHADRKREWRDRSAADSAAPARTDLDGVPGGLQPERRHAAARSGGPTEDVRSSQDSGWLRPVCAIALLRGATLAAQETRLRRPAASASSDHRYAPLRQARFQRPVEPRARAIRSPALPRVPRSGELARLRLFRRDAADDP